MSEENSETFNKVTCCSCGILFGFPKRIEEEWRRTEKQFHCPNGHPLAWNKEKDADKKEISALKTEVKSLKEKLETANQKASEQEKKIAELTTELEIWQPSSITNKESNGTDQVRSGD